MAMAASESTGEIMTIFIGGLPGQTTKVDVMCFVQKFCPVLGISLPRKSGTDKCKGYAFVKVNSGPNLERLLSNHNIINGRRVDCQLALNKSDKIAYLADLQQRKLFISGISPDADIHALVSALSAYGPLRNCYRLKPRKKDKGLAFAEFTNPEAALAVINGGLLIEGKIAKVSFYRSKVSDNRLVDAENSEFKESSPLPINYSEDHQKLSRSLQRVKSGCGVWSPNASSRYHSEPLPNNYSFRVAIPPSLLPIGKLKRLLLPSGTVYVKQW